MIQKRISWGVTMLVLVAAEANAASKVQLRLTPHVDERVELMSIIFRLAGSFEYNMSPLTGYTSDIDRYFAPYKTHPAVVMAAKMREENGVAFDAVMSMAVSLSQPPALKPLVPFSDEIPDKRWGKENALKFAALADDFYRDTHFQNFYDAHRNMYRGAETSFKNVLRDLDLGWYENFYGEAPRGHFNLILGLNNGGGNYGPHVVLPDGREEMYAIIGCWTKDSAGNPTFDAQSGYLSTVIHEFNHSFMNPLVDEHKAEFGFADAIYRPVSTQLAAAEYGGPTEMLYESLVRAAVIEYFAGRDSQSLERKIRKEQAAGFLWMDDLVALLRKYENERTKYRTFSAFMPQVVGFFREVATHIDAKMAEFDRHCAHVTGVRPFANDSQNVDPETKEVIVIFDKALDPTRSSINGNPGAQNPHVGKVEFLPGDRSIKIPVALKGGVSYAFTLTSYAFATTDGYPLKSYSISFRTK